MIYVSYYPLCMFIKDMMILIKIKNKGYLIEDTDSCYVIKKL